MGVLPITINQLGFFDPKTPCWLWLLYPTHFCLAADMTPGRTCDVWNPTPFGLFVPFQSQCCCSFTIFYTLHNLIPSIPIHSAQGPTTHPAPRALRWVRLPRRRPRRTAAVPTFGRGDLTTRPTSVRQWTLRSCAGHWWGLADFWRFSGEMLGMGWRVFFWIKPSNSRWFRSWHSSPK